MKQADRDSLCILFLGLCYCVAVLWLLWSFISG